MEDAERMLRDIKNAQLDVIERAISPPSVCQAPGLMAQAEAEAMRDLGAQVTTRDILAAMVGLGELVPPLESGDALKLQTILNDWYAERIAAAAEQRSETVE